MDTLKKIARIPLFKNLNQGDLFNLFEQQTHYIKKYLRGSFVAFRGSEISSLMILLSGSIRTEMHDLNGNIKQIETIKKNQILAPAFLFGPKTIFPVDVIATEESTLLIIPRENFLMMMQNNRIILKSYLDLISDKAQFLSKKIWFSFSKRTIRQKIASYLLQNNNHNQIKLNSTLTHLAHTFDVTRPSLSRELSKMIKEGLIIQVDQKSYTIPKPQLLRAIAGE